MREANYKNPEKNIKKYPAVACIMPVYVPIGQIEKYQVRSNINPDNYYPFTENKLTSIKFTLACYKYYNAGIDYDLIIVNNGSKDEETLEFLKTLPNVYHRENQGFSFGAHKYAWEKFGDKYDYYLFHEQDWGPARDNWLNEILIKFLSNRDIGAVGNVVEDRPTEPIGNIGSLKEILGTKREFLYNLDGCYTFTSSNVLKQVDKYGGLQVLDCEPKTNLNAMYNEILFVQPILELGYKVVSFHDNEHIQTVGVAIADLKKEQEEMSDNQIAPIIQGNVRFFSKRMKEYFAWYDDTTNL